MCSDAQGRACLYARPVPLDEALPRHPDKPQKRHNEQPLTSHYLHDLLVGFSTRQTYRVFTETPGGDRDARPGYEARWIKRDPSPDEPWALYLADSKRRYGWLGFDFDDKDVLGADRVAADVALLTGWLEAHQIPHLVCASGGGQGRHVWVRLTTRVWHERVAKLAAELRRVLGTLDHGMLRNPRSGVLRGPGSPHKDGQHRSEPLPTAGRCAADALAWMLEGTDGRQLVSGLLNWAYTLPSADRPATTPAPTQGPEVAPIQGPVQLPTAMVRSFAVQAEAFDTAVTDHPLPPVILRLATTTPPAGTDTSVTAFTILVAMSRAGWSRTAVHAAAARYPGLTHLVTENHNGIRTPRVGVTAHIDRQWDKAQEAAAERPAPRRVWATDTELADLVNTAAMAAEQDPLFHGQRGATILSVFYALLEQITIAGTTVVDLSTRRWALACGGSRGDTHRLITQLVEAGWIRCTARPKGVLAYSYTIGERAGQTYGTQESPAAGARGETGHQISDFLTHLRHDAWTVLGAGAARLHHQLLAGPALPTMVLADQTRLTVADTAALLDQLEMVGLVEFRAGHWHGIGGPGALGYAADVLGAAGVLEARRARYKAESIAWAWWTEEQAIRCRDRSPGLLTARYGRFPTTWLGRCAWAEAVDHVMSGAHQLELDYGLAA